MGTYLDFLTGVLNADGESSGRDDSRTASLLSLSKGMQGADCFAAGSV